MEITKDTSGRTEFSFKDQMNITRNYVKYPSGADNYLTERLYWIGDNGGRTVVTMSDEDMLDLFRAYVIMKAEYDETR